MITFKNELIISFLSVLLTIMIGGCDSGSDLPFPTAKPKLVVNCLANPNDIFKVTVQLSSPLSSSADVVTRDSCIVEIQIPGAGSELFSFFPDGKGGGYYASPGLFPQAGNTYKLKIVDPVYGNVNAEDVIPILPAGYQLLAQSQIVSVDTIGFNLELIRYKCKVNFPQPQGTGSVYYHLLINELVHDIMGFDFNRPANIDVLVEDNTMVKVFNKSSLLISGNSNLKDFILEFECLAENKPNLQTIKNLNFELRMVSKNYYNYFSSINYQLKSGGNPLENPPPLFTNVKEGLGVFGGYNSASNTIKFPE